MLGKRPLHSTKMVIKRVNKRLNFQKTGFLTKFFKFLGNVMAKQTAKIEVTRIPRNAVRLFCSNRIN